MESREQKTGWRDLTPEALAAAKALLHEADHGAIATMRPADGWPRASRVGLALLPDGTPLVIASALTGHFRALEAEPRCGLLVGARGTGEPLAQPRLSLACRAAMLAPENAEAAVARTCYLARHPKAAIYVDLPDFRFFRLTIAEAEFNAGFGRAYVIAGHDLSG